MVQFSTKGATVLSILTAQRRLHIRDILQMMLVITGAIKIGMFITRKHKTEGIYISKLEERK